MEKLTIYYDFDVEQDFMAEFCVKRKRLDWPGI